MMSDRFCGEFWEWRLSWKLVFVVNGDVGLEVRRWRSFTRLGWSC